MDETRTNVRLVVNGRPVEREVPADMTLLRFLREELGLTGTKCGCETGHCGACTVVLKGKATRSCLVKMGSARLQGAEILTVEGLARQGRLHPLQAAFIEQGALQCGFCTPGMLMCATALLSANPEPDETAIKEALTRNRNLCRCTGYAPIVRAIRDASRRIAGGDQGPPMDTFIAQEGMQELHLRRDAVPLVTGTTRFADDIQLPGMLHGAILWSEYPHARILRIDTSEAEALPGVARVIIAKDIPGENQAGQLTPDQPAIAEEKVRFVGDPIAAVFAESLDIARQALQHIHVDYEPLPGVFTIEEARRPDAPPVHAAGNLFHHVHMERGDPDAAMRGCAHVVDYTFEVPRIEHAFLEPESGIAMPDESGAGIVLLVGSQTVFTQRARLARILAMPEEKVRVVNLPTGGAFGGKQDLLHHPFLALGALLTGRPVKITLSRAESLRAHVKRHPAIMHYRVGSDDQGHILALEAEIHVDTGAYASNGRDVLETMVSLAAGPYFLPHFRIHGWAWYTNNVPCGAMRGFGVNQVTFAMESCVDELARRLGMDPFEIRERNALRAGMPTITDQVLEPWSATLPETLAAAKEAFHALSIPPSSGSKRIGVGVAGCMKNFGFGLNAPESAGARLELHADGRAAVYISQHEFGQAARRTLAGLAAEELGLPVEQIDVIAADTALTPPAGPSSGSRQTFLSGNAILRACAELKEHLRAQAAEALDVSPDEITLQGDHLVHQPSGRRLPLRALGEEFTVEADYHPPETAPLREQSQWGRPDFTSHPTYYGYAYGAHVAVVEVDTQSGAVRVLTHIAAHDVGRALNPASVRGQIEGGVMMGLGYALSEEFLTEGGKNLTDSLGQCGVPLAGSLPEIIPILVENPHPLGPAGAKGLGELPTLAATPAIINAIRDALGVRVCRLPAKHVLSP